MSYSTHGYILNNITLPINASQQEAFTIAAKKLKSLGINTKNEKKAGILENADLSNINLSQFLEDGKKIEIPFTKDENPNANENNTLININTASHEQLQTLPGIGKVKADSIINSRENNGPFKKAADIMKVSGIGEATYEKFKDMICVD